MTLLRHRCAFALLGLVVFGGAQADPVIGIRDPLPAISFSDWRRMGGDEETTEYALSFPSAFTTSYKINNTVPLTVFMPANRKGPIPAVIILHYWGARDLRTERSMAKELARKGIAGVVVTLPYHLQRTPAGYSSGALAVRPDPDRMIEMMTQSVLDVRRTLRWIESRSEFDLNRIGVGGISLGALVASYSFAIEPRFYRGAFILGGVDIAHILWNSTVVASDRDRLQKLGYNEASLREKLAIIEPANVLSERKTGKGFVVGANYDSVIPRQDTEQLIRLLPDHETLWIDTGHYGGIFVQRRLSRIVAEFFDKEFAGLAFEAPKSIYAPTIRIGGEADVQDGFQIAIGLDLLRSGNKGSVIASLLFTPTDPQLFLGYQFDSHISPGIFLKTNRVSIGIFWSIVL